MQLIISVLIGNEHLSTQNEMACITSVIDAFMDLRYHYFFPKQDGLHHYDWKCLSVKCLIS